MDPVTSKLAGKAVSITLWVVGAAVATTAGWFASKLWHAYKQGDVVRAAKAGASKPAASQPVEVV